MHVSSRNFLISLVFGSAVLNDVEARPSLATAVELSTCGDGPSYHMVEQCLPTCQPVLNAQNCSMNAACTCATAPPTSLQACLQCQIDANKGRAPSVLARVIPAKLVEYSELCGEQPPAQALLRYAADSEASNATLRRRELVPTMCIYGLPEIATSPVAVLESGKRAWPFFAVAVVIIICYFERRSNK